MTIRRIVQCSLAFLVLSEADAFLGLENLFGGNDVKDYRVYWNVPTFMCHKYGMHFEEVSRHFQMIQNPGDSFRGNEIVILYDPGMFPALLKTPKGSLMKRNGGVPQEGNLTAHLELLREHLVEQIPDHSFSGVGIIDFESWRPIFRQNWASLAPYRDLSLKIAKERHPHWDEKSQRREAVREFEKWARVFMEETLKTAKSLRPNAVWGYYAYPYCFNLTPHQTSSRCDPRVIQENDNMAWLFRDENVLFPSVYLRSNLSRNEKIGLINGRIKEAVRVARKSKPRTKVLAYFWYKYQDRRDVFLSKTDVVNGIREIMGQGADGYVIWGSSDDLNSREKCQNFRDYVNDVLGPAIVDSKDTLNQRDIEDENFTENSQVIASNRTESTTNQDNRLISHFPESQTVPSAISIP